MSDNSLLLQTLKELSQAKEWSESLIQSIVEGIITCDAQGQIIFFSEGSARITGWIATEALGRSINDVLPLHHGHSALFMDFIPPEGGRRSVVIRSRDQQPLTLSITRSHQPDESQITLVLHDITDEVRHRSAQAYFLANISHEFRTPLAGMKVSIELLLENARYLSTSEMDELLRSIHLSVSSLQNLIDNLLESSKIETNHFTLRRKPAEFNQLLSEAVRMMQPLLNRRHQLLGLEEPLQMPNLNADTNRIIQVIVNLLSNASKYSPMGSTIDMRIEQREKFVLVSVADQGVGIPESQQDIIFKRFVRLEAEAEADYGAGIGLSVVKAIVEAHGGQVGVSGRAGGGSVFWFTLPIEEAA